MARKTLLEVDYTFNPATKTVVIPRIINREKLVLITNVTKNIVIYNFSDLDYKATEYYQYVSPGNSWNYLTTLGVNQVVSWGNNLYAVTVGGTSGTVVPTHVSGTVAATGGTASLKFLKVLPELGKEETIVVLEYDTAAQAASDKLQFLLDEPEERFAPGETIVDAVSKFRVSTPQALIDTDFEYGLQSTKWDQIQQVGSRGGPLYSSSEPITISGHSFVDDITSTFTGTFAAPAVGSFVLIQNSPNWYWNGWYRVSASAVNSVTIKHQNREVGGSGNGTYHTARTFTPPVYLSNTMWLDGKTNIFFSLPASNSGVFITASAGVPTVVTENVVITGATSVVLGAGTGVSVSCSSTRGLVVGHAGTVTAGTGTWGAARITSITSETSFECNVLGAPLVSASVTFPTVKVTMPGSNWYERNHGLTPGSQVLVGNTASGTNPFFGPCVVTRVENGANFHLAPLNMSPNAWTAPVVDSVSLAYRPTSNALHRSEDGGVRMELNSEGIGQIFSRQTRKYFRYQSGKGIQFSTGTNLRAPIKHNGFRKPVGSVSNLLVAVTKFKNTLKVGAQIRVVSTQYPSLSGIYTVSVANEFSFGFTPVSLPAEFNNETGMDSRMVVTPMGWKGAAVRVGMFDAANGLFFEDDGAGLNAVIRTSTEIAGVAGVTNGSCTVTLSPTSASSVANGNLDPRDILPGDTVVIKGQSYKVAGFTMNATASPGNIISLAAPYRGLTDAAAIICTVTERRWAQAQFNMDKLDGSGPSGYTLDLSKMQMFYIDYSWYGAGAVRFGFKDQRGNVLYCHRIANANLQTRAYMRSGNLPARYEIATGTVSSFVTSNVDASASTITVNSASRFPTDGYLMIVGPSGGFQQNELVRYTGKSGNTFTGVTRAEFAYQQSGNLSPVAFASGTPSASIVTGTVAILAGADYVPSLAHWGSSVIMDGRFDDDKQFVFQGGTTVPLTNLAAAPNNNVGVISLRIGPSVHNGVVGLFSFRDMVNRMQLALDSLGMVVSAGATTPLQLLVKVILNGRLSTAVGNNWVNVGGSSLAQVMIHPAGTLITGGETILSFYATSSPSSATVVEQVLVKVRELGTSINSGGLLTAGSTDGSNIYPDGPDVVTISVSNISAQTVNSVAARISWTEAQA